MLKGRIVSGKIVSILLAVTMMAGCILTGCGSGESGGLGAGGKEAEAANGPAGGKGEGSQDGTSGKPAEVSVIIETFDNTFASFVMNAMKKYEEEHKDKIHITYLDSKQDANTQISQVENQILNGTQAIICLAVDAKQSEPIVRACKEAGCRLLPLTASLKIVTALWARTAQWPALCWPGLQGKRQAEKAMWRL